MEAAIIWIALIIIFAVVEIITVGLTSIWFAGGAVVALLVDAAGLGPVWQFAAFVVLSLIHIYLWFERMSSIVSGCRCCNFC